MSYYTKFELTFEWHRPDIRAVIERARSHLESHPDQYPEADSLLEELRKALKNDRGEFAGQYSEDIEGLMKHVSGGFPGLIFFVRGMGEEFPDVWLRLFRDGKILFRAGPFDDELDRALGED